MKKPSPEKVTAPLRLCARENPVNDVAGKQTRKIAAQGGDNGRAAWTRGIEAEELPVVKIAPAPINSG